MALLLCLGLLIGCSGSPSASEPDLPSLEEGALLSPSGEPLARGDFLEKARGAEYILIGETHDNACDHRVQTRLIRWLASDGTRTGVGLEMVAASRQNILQRFSAGGLDLDNLPESLNWEETWGHPFSGYRPIFRAAREAGFPVYGLNISEQVLDAVREKGRAALEGRKRPRQLIPPAPEEKKVLTRMYERHEQLPGLRNRTGWNRERFFLIQAVWDSSMAAEARRIRSRTGRRMVVLVGQGHMLHGRGIPRRLRKLDPEADMITISPWRGLDHPEPGQSDILFFCPVTFESRLGFSLRLTSRGGLITRVAPRSRAERAGMRPGDVLVAAGGEQFRALMDLHQAAVRAHRGSGPLVLRVERDGERVGLRLNISKHPDTLNNSGRWRPDLDL